MLDPNDSTTLRAIVDAAVAARLTDLSFWGGLGPNSMPHLAHLIRTSETLQSLCMANTSGILEDPEDVRLLRQALRANRTLTSLTFTGWSGEDSDQRLSLLGSLIGHPTLTHLTLDSWVLEDDEDPEWELEQEVEPQPALGAMLAALLAANSPALIALDAHYCGLDENACSLVLDGLSANKHLERLMISNESPNGYFSNEFAVSRLLPAVEACTTLRAVYFGGACTATDLVAQREGARLQAELMREPGRTGFSE